MKIPEDRMNEILQRRHKEKMLSREEAAEFLGVKASTLAKWACKKRYTLPRYKIGRHIKYRVTDLQKFIDDSLIE